MNYEDIWKRWCS